MSVKLKGAEFKAYYNDDAYWGKDSWYDDYAIKVNGKYAEDLVEEEIPDDADMIIESGTVYIPTQTESGCVEKEVNLVTHFKNWRKQQTEKFVVVCFSKEKEEQIMAIIKTIDGVISVK